MKQSRNRKIAQKRAGDGDHTLPPSGRQPTGTVKLVSGLTVQHSGHDVTAATSLSTRKQTLLRINARKIIISLWNRYIWNKYIAFLHFFNSFLFHLFL